MPKPRTPTALKLLKGGGQAKRLGANGEPEPNLLDSLEPPEHLRPRSAAVWREVAPMLREMKVLTVADVIALEMLSDAVADYRLARANCGDQFVASTPKGGQMLSQWVVAMQMSCKRAEGFMAKFGMDPVARSRVLIGPQTGLFANTPGSNTSRFFT